VKRDAVEKVIYEKEMKISKKISDVDAAILGFNNKARQNQLIPSTARYARGADFQIRFTHHSPESNIEEIKKITKVRTLLKFINFFPWVDFLFLFLFLSFSLRWNN
jgi:hypothetical protein